MQIIGFTGTRHGMTKAQQAQVAFHLSWLRPQLVVHGGAIGSDAQFDRIARIMNIYRLIFPSNLLNQQMSNEGGKWLEPRSPLARNRDIVAASDVLLATPAGPEIVRSGTWATIRCARQKNLYIFVLMPDGQVNRE